MREHAQKAGNKAVERLFDHLYQLMEAWYAQGNFALNEIGLRALLNQSMDEVGPRLDTGSVADAISFFHNEINNRIFRHQTLGWIADSGVNLHLWGKGWETHPRFARYAKGIADNHRELPFIYRASKINLQVTPHGSVHQRLLDGLAAGGFFLLRWHPGDAVGLKYRELLTWCQANGISSDQELHARANQRVREIVARIDRFEKSTPATRAFSVFDITQAHADADFRISADGIWPEYQSVSFDSGAELEAKMIRFLGDPSAREQIASSMREAVIEWFSYASINRRLLKMMVTKMPEEQAKCAA
jgi:hypothetical protein